MLFECLLRRIDDLFRLVANVDKFAALLVCARVFFGFATHAINFILAQTTRTRDANFLLLTAGLIRRSDIHDAVDID